MSGFRELGELLEHFYNERNWHQFQQPKDVAASLAVEAAELQELFLWLDEPAQQGVLVERRGEVASELADIIINCLNLGRLAGIDLEESVRLKVAVLAEKYPAEEVRGKVIAHP